MRKGTVGRGMPPRQIPSCACQHYQRETVNGH